MGTAKAGTSFLLKYLKQHPDLFIPNTNQLHFHSKLKNFSGPFDKHYKLKQTKYFMEYIKNFEGSVSEKKIGEIATDYLYSYKNSIKSIKENIGDEVKIVIVLRNPIDRTFSQYKHVLSNFHEPLNFWDAIDAEIERKKPYIPVTVIENISWNDFVQITVNLPSLPGIVPEVVFKRLYLILEIYF